MNSKNIFSLRRYYELARQTGAEISIIGYSRRRRPIKVLKKGSGKIKLLLISRIHGNEPATTEALIRFFNEFDSRQITVYGVLMANPDGASLYNKLWLKNPASTWENHFSESRFNANNIDINRDWLDLTQRETCILQKFILKIRPHFAVDLHEYYWSDKGYPPKHPTEDEDGFMATFTDAPFFGTSNFVKKISEEAMNSLTESLRNEFCWKIKPRHFIGEPRNIYTNPTFLGVYLALRGIPKLLIETWGVGCATLLLKERILFHKRAIELLLEWIIENKMEILSRENSRTKITANLFDESGRDEFLNKLNLHNIKYKLVNGDITVYCTSLETGFIKSIYYLIFQKEMITK